MSKLQESKNIVRMMIQSEGLAVYDVFENTDNSFFFITNIFCQIKSKIERRFKNLQLY